MTPPDPADLIARLDLPTQVSLLSGGDAWHTQEVAGLLPPVLLTDGPHGVRVQAEQHGALGLGRSHPATCFPTAAALGSTWDPDLLEEVGRALGREARARDVAVLLGPGLNLKRHPQGGRSFEYLAEDPHLAGTLAASMVRGIQAEGVAACPKHLAVNNHEAMRMVVDVIVDQRTLRELYLRAFEIVVTTAAPQTIMTAYNRVNGPWCSDSRWLLQDVLRDDWGFDGLVMSDWGGTNDRIAALRAGLDLEMPGGAAAFDAEVLTAVDAGDLDPSLVTRSAARVAALAQAHHPVEEGDRPAVDHEAHHALARRTAAAGTVLLTDDGLLPLDPGRSTALIGAFAADPRIQGAGSSKVQPTRLDTLAEVLAPAMAAAGGSATVLRADGYDPAEGETSPALLAEAARTARDVEQVVLVVGLPAAAESEGVDRAHCRLPAGQQQLITTVCAANPRTVVVVMGGAVVELPWADRPAAILLPWLGGQAGGAALADVLLGVAEPGGRLSESIPAVATDLPATAEFPGEGGLTAPRQVVHRERHLVGYRFHDTAGVPPRFPFGHGLGYTTWTWAQPEVTGEGTDLTVGVPVTNSGGRPGAAVVQVYLARPGSAVPRPSKELRGFAKVHAAPGETAWAQVRLDRRSFAIWDAVQQAWLVEGGSWRVLVGASSGDVRHVVDLVVPSADIITPVPDTAGPVADDAEMARLLGHPVPPPSSARPLTRSSPVADLDATPAGRVLLRALRAGAGRAVQDEGFEPGAMQSFLEGMPLRALVQFGLVPSMAVVDRVAAAVDGRLRDALRR